MSKVIARIKIQKSFEQVMLEPIGIDLDTNQGTIQKLPQLYILHIEIN